VHAVDPQPIEVLDDLDVAFLRITDSAPSSVATIMPPVPVRRAVPGERLFILHHSRGDVLQVSRTFCRAATIQLQPDREVQHTCGTFAGSSGALLFAERDGALIGIHHSALKSSERVAGFAASFAAIAMRSAVLNTR
jgi:hypothetical protein